MLFRSREKIFNHMMIWEKWMCHMFSLLQYWKKLSSWDNLYFYSVRAERILSRWGLGPFLFIFLPFFPKKCISELNFKWGSGLQSSLVPPSLFLFYFHEVTYFPYHGRGPMWCSVYKFLDVIFSFKNTSNSRLIHSSFTSYGSVSHPCLMTFNYFNFLIQG